MINFKIPTSSGVARRLMLISEFSENVELDQNIMYLAKENLSDFSEFPLEFMNRTSKIVLQYAIDCEYRCIIPNINRIVALIAAITAKPSHITVFSMLSQQEWKMNWNNINFGSREDIDFKIISDQESLQLQTHSGRRTGILILEYNSYNSYSNDSNVMRMLAREYPKTMLVGQHRHSHSFGYATKILFPSLYEKVSSSSESSLLQQLPYFNYFQEKYENSKAYEIIV